ncbi:hypothetical protein [Capnocytophaga stomatis]|uniref:hypothetical protein n=1 Tax=Capnocytophaga stomatis TaxID=1848904 RepID=UPI001951B0D9|nr:hypothetical protein [Capnocytophaga stomatis]
MKTNNIISFSFYVTPNHYQPVVDYLDFRISFYNLKAIWVDNQPLDRSFQMSEYKLAFVVQYTEASRHLSRPLLEQALLYDLQVLQELGNIYGLEV